MEDQHGLSLKEVNAANQELDFNNSNDRLENKNRRQSVGGNGKPETEEEKRRNFLERNRQAALKCRQRKKAWLANLQTKVGMLTTENESLQMTINQLREEIDSFRSILVSHKDCPISVGNNRAACTTIGELVGHETGLAANAAAIIVQQQQNSRAPLQHHQHPVSTVHHSQQGQNFQRPSTGPNHRYATGVAPQFSNGY
ncbi:hypothetical protein BY996DRAFT_4575930 [Phakopsora pachyrhizi]|uniref:Expressed protein n=1 Tax=Phakopsora pachyrhizi TaxID=170000 RepID=A0AAV0ADU7_PHAPC|nr:hypothetical protein BY996DRAFT_4575930 [Phakopsora pachyrhizi]CAH7666206.1 expressed protein [Phakopsora pachyrhizi]